MSRRTKNSTRSLKLDVIVEEDSIANIDHLTISNVNSLHNSTTSQNSSTCIVTLRNTPQPNGNEPQFLHTGAWPSIDMVEDTIDHDVDVLDHKIDACTIIVPSKHPGIDNIVIANNATDPWGLVTTDQMSMAMDYWDPNRNANPLSTTIIESIGTTKPSTKSTCKSMNAIQQFLFLREIMDEHLTRVQTVEHIEELEDNDSAVEVVAILEGYRQNGWADEMIKAFPKECWLFWSNNGLNVTENIEVCAEDGYPLFRH